MEKQNKEQLEAVRKQAEKEQQTLRVAVEHDKKQREKLDKMKEEEVYVYALIWKEKVATLDGLQDLVARDKEKSSPRWQNMSYNLGPR